MRLGLSAPSLGVVEKLLQSYSVKVMCPIHYYQRAVPNAYGLHAARVVETGKLQEYLVTQQGAPCDAINLAASHLNRERSKPGAKFMKRCANSLYAVACVEYMTESGAMPTD